MNKELWNCWKIHPTIPTYPLAPYTNNGYSKKTSKNPNGVFRGYHGG
jgi:hypothetical protein